MGSIGFDTLLERLEKLYADSALLCDVNRGPCPHEQLKTICVTKSLFSFPVACVTPSQLP